MSLDAVTFHARRSPDKTAIIDAGGQHHSYRQTCNDMVGMCLLLQRECPDLVQLQPVALACSDRHLYLLLVFALEALGVTTLPFAQPADGSMRRALACCRLVIADTPLADSCAQFLRVADNWIEQARQQLRPDRFKPMHWAQDGVPLLLLTSGTSGEAKVILYHRAAIEFREADRCVRYGFDAASVFLISVPPSISTTYLSARAVFRCGATLMFWHPADVLGALKVATHTTLLPVHMRVLLDALPSNYVPLGPLRIFSIGAPLPQHLRQQAIARLNAILEDSYGTNEVGALLRIGSDGVGDVVPGADVEIVDEAFMPVPRGVPGQIIGRSDGMAQGYLNPEHNRHRFVDGWFVTGDVGVARGPRRIELKGRADSMLNLGGHKLAPDPIEDALRRQGVAADLGLCTIANRDGVNDLYVALEQPQLADAEIVTAVAAAVGLGYINVHIVRVERLPRGAGSKLMRAELADMIRRARPV